MSQFNRIDAGIAHWLRLAEWLRQQRGLLELSPQEGALTIQRRFNVSRATAYRWLAGWREVCADQRGKRA